MAMFDDKNHNLFGFSTTTKLYCGLDTHIFVLV